MSNEIIAATPEVNAIEAIQPKIMVGFDTSTYEGTARLFNSMNSAVSLSDENPGKLAINGLVVRPAKQTDPVTGEVRDTLETILITVDGTAYFSRSDGIAKSAVAFMAAFGKLGFPSEGATIVFKTVKLSGGRTYKNFEVEL